MYPAYIEVAKFQEEKNAQRSLNGLTPVKNCINSFLKEHSSRSTQEKM
ncbi:hypothetical protein [Methanosarcina horonobensis]|nr:hypothetical protein [Methanosarcina horonobensis]